MLFIDGNASGQTFQVSVGQVLELRLRENPTSGFRWSFTSTGEPACKLAGDNFDHDFGTVGRGGEHLWRFQASQSGACNITLVYRRKWETGVPPRKAFTIHVQVTEHD